MGRWLRIVNETAQGIATVILIGGGVTFAYSYVEGYTNPVMGPLAVSNVHPLEDEQFAVGFDGTAMKLRQCDWVESRWYIGKRFEPSVRTLWTFSEPPEVRLTGELAWHDMTVQMTPEQLLRDSHADTVHKCPWSPWNTVTPFWDSNDDIPVPAHLIKETAS
tara:strand:- start:39039 stop:39524 length:486 start_codon:yes stop_codon:yes gene_type:complete